MIMMKTKSKIPEIIVPTYWEETILFSCPGCGYENTLEFLKLEQKLCDYNGSMLYFAACPSCKKEHIVLG